MGLPKLIAWGAKGDTGVVGICTNPKERFLFDVFEPGVVPGVETRIRRNLGDELLLDEFELE
jgi:hypothetical protein